MMYNLNEFSRREKKELKKRLFSDLDRVRRLSNRIESRDNGVRPSIPFWPPMAQPVSLAVETLTQKQTMKATGKNNGKKHLRKKRGAGASSFPYDRYTKRPLVVSNSSISKVLSSVSCMMNRCGQILTKLMKHKHGWIFNTPVDVKGLGLHDYYQIVKSPMDLGTVKFRLEKHAYESSLDFAADVRKTFNNAMIYNPKGQDVYTMAETLLNLFEKMFNQVCKKYDAEKGEINVAAAATAAAEQLNHPKNFPETEPLPMQKSLDESIWIAKTSVTVRPQLNLQLPAEVQNVKSSVSMPPALQPIARSRKLLKPKAEDPYKRDMTAEEKQKLGAVLQELPSEKLNRMIQIVKKRTSNLVHEGDEIEVDIENLDNETLSELDKFVGYHQRSVSKLQCQMIFQEMARTEQIVAKHSPKDEPMENEGQQLKKGDVGEEEVDIGEEIPVNNFPPVEIERDAASASIDSSNSGSGSSSSSDSDSESSSGSDSDEDSVQSPFFVREDNLC